MTALPLPEFTPGRPAAAVDTALRQSLAACEEARRCAVLWFAEVQRRELWRAFGHASLELYAVHRLGFSRNRYWQFKRLADDLERLPALHEAVSEGRVGWTKAQQVARVATPGTESSWVRCAEQNGRRELAAAVTAEVARVKGVARKAASASSAASQLALGLAASGAGDCAAGGDARGAPAPTNAATLAIPATIALRADALQAARFEALVEQARKRGLVPAQAGRMELVLAALERLVADGVDDDLPVAATGSGSRRPRPRCRIATPPAQVIVHQCPDCEAATVTTTAGERPLAPAHVAALACDARVREPGKPNRATIPPRVRRGVLARDRYRCTTPGCGATAFLEVHHLRPRSRGGSNKADNLVTLCARCHAFAHAHAHEGALAPAQAPEIGA